MLSMDDCIGFSGLNEDEIAAIAEHEHIALVVAAEMGQCLLGDPAGRRRIAAIICDDIETANAHGAARHATELNHALQAFLHDHPDALPRA
jgi:hypothetical protein